MTMRRDWDYVTFGDYQADMQESAARSLGVIEELKRRAEDAERRLAMVVVAAGGRVTIPDGLLRDPRKQFELTVWRNDADRSFEVTARSHGELTPKEK